MNKLCCLVTLDGLSFVSAFVKARAKVLLLFSAVLTTYKQQNQQTKTKTKTQYLIFRVFSDCSLPPNYDFFCNKYLEARMKKGMPAVPRDCKGPGG